MAKLKKIIVGLFIALFVCLPACTQAPAETEQIVPSVTASGNNPSSKSDRASIQVFFNDPWEKQRDDTLQRVILDAIADAEYSIDLATYNFTDTKTRDALVVAQRRGVQVRIVIHSENADKDAIRALEKAGIGVVASQSNGLMHAKYIVIDRRITISGSANITPGSFFYDNNFMILVDDKVVSELFRAEFEEKFTDRKFGSASPKTPSADIITLADGTRLLVRFSPDDSVENNLIAIAQAGKESIYLLAYSFASDPIGETLIHRYDAGLNVEVIFEKDKAYTDDGGEAEKLKRAGIPIYLDGSDGLMHEKAIIFDKSVVAAGSYNFTRSADTRNDEQLLIIDNEFIAEEFLAEYEKILMQSEPVR